MKKSMIISLIGMLFLLLCGSACAEELPQTSLEMTRRMGNGINLGNTMEACDNSNHGGYITDDTVHYETLWGQPVTTAEMVRGMKAAGFDTLRIPVAWMTNATHLNQGDYTISPAYLQRIREIVDYALEADMFVIVNDHWDGGWWGMFGSDTEATRELAMEAYTGMWKQIGETFAEYDSRLIFEIANEELGARFDENSALYCQDSIDNKLSEDERYALTNRVNQAFVDTIRGLGGNNAERFLLIAGFGTDIAKTFDSRFVMPKDTAESRLMISVHYYSPTTYCLAPDAASATPWGKQKDYADMYATLSMMKRFTAAGYGVVIGEYGALSGSDGIMKENAPAYHKAFLDCCDALDMTGCLWDTGGFYDRKACAVTQKEIAELYAGRNAASEEGKDPETIAAAAKEAFDAAAAAAPETFGTRTVSADSCVAWIMFNSGDYGVTYSVGDVYTPDSMTPGVVPTDVEITGAGTYTVGLDFTGTGAGYANNVAFSAVGISNGEDLFPGYCILITELKINGESVKLKGRNYTCADDGHCTRSNLYNEWVDIKGAREGARVLMGDLTGISATILDTSADIMKEIRTMEITFRYEPRKGK